MLWLPERPWSQVLMWPWMEAWCWLQLLTQTGLLLRSYWLTVDSWKKNWSRILCFDIVFGVDKKKLGCSESLRKSAWKTRNYSHPNLLIIPNKMDILIPCLIQVLQPDARPHPGWEGDTKVEEVHRRIARGGGRKYPELNDCVKLWMDWWMTLLKVSLGNIFTEESSCLFLTHRLACKNLFYGMRAVPSRWLLSEVCSIE